MLNNCSSCKSCDVVCLTTKKSSSYGQITTFSAFKWACHCWCVVSELQLNPLSQVGVLLHKFWVVILGKLKSTWIELPFVIYTLLDSLMFIIITYFVIYLSYDLFLLVERLLSKFATTALQAIFIRIRWYSASRIF